MQSILAHRQPYDAYCSNSGHNAKFLQKFGIEGTKRRLQN
jgi:hypothetical protein